MKVQDIVAGVNAKLAGETLTYTQMRLFLDEVIDDINAALSANFPTFDNISSSGEYTAFPDRYIRSVVITGAAYKFYVTDEEGNQTAPQYQWDYQDRLFLMKRDYIELVPEEYQEPDHGYITYPQNAVDSYSQPLFRGW